MHALRYRGSWQLAYAAAHTYILAAPATHAFLMHARPHTPHACTAPHPSCMYRYYSLPSHTSPPPHCYPTCMHGPTLLMHARPHTMSVMLWKCSWWVDLDLPLDLDQGGLDQGLPQHLPPCTMLRECRYTMPAHMSCMCMCGGWGGGGGVRVASRQGLGEGWGARAPTCAHGSGQGLGGWGSGVRELGPWGPAWSALHGILGA